MANTSTPFFKADALSPSSEPGLFTREMYTKPGHGFILHEIEDYNRCRSHYVAILHESGELIVVPPEITENVEPGNILKSMELAPRYVETLLRLST